MSGRKNVEATIQQQLVLWLRLQHPSVEIKSNKNEDAGNVVKAMINKRMGRAEAGYPDLTLTYDKGDITYILELELKTKTGKLSDVQKTWHSRFQPTKNRMAKIAWGFEEAQKAIQSWLSTLPVS
jgi:hypothetical protein